MKTIDYAEVERALKESFEEFIENPSAFGIKDTDQIIAIQSISELQKHGFLELSQNIALFKVGELNNKHISDSFVSDLTQNTATVATATFTEIIRFPEKHHYLDEDTIQSIQALSQEKKDVFLNELANNTTYEELIDKNNFVQDAETTQLVEKITNQAKLEINKILEALGIFTVTLIEEEQAKEIPVDIIGDLEPALEDITEEYDVSLNGEELDITN